MGLQWRAGEATSGAAGRVEESLTKGLKAGIRVPGVQLHQCVRAGLKAFCRCKDLVLSEHFISQWSTLLLSVNEHTGNLESGSVLENK